MNKQFNRLLFIFLAVIIALPVIINFSIIYINFIPSAGNNSEMLSFYGSYFGGVLGGLATLITIYFTFLNVKEEHKPLLYFNNKNVFYYRNKSGIENVFSNKLIQNCDDEISNNEINEILEFDIENVGRFPALDVKMSIINTKDFLESIKLLKPENEILNKINKSYSKDNMEFQIRSLFKSQDVIKVDQTYIFEGLLSKLIYVFNINVKNKNFANNNYAIKGNFKLYDILIEYSDIDNIRYRDVYSVYIRINDTLNMTSQLIKYETWKVVTEFIKRRN